MKKILIFGLFALSIGACQTIEKEDKTETNTPPKIVTSTKMDRIEKKKLVNNFKAALEAKKASANKKWTADQVDLHQNGIDEVAKSGITGKAIQVGQKAPDFILVNQSGKEVKLSEKLKKGPVVLTWYRGGWCPYCNLTLSALQVVLPDIQALNGTLLALTPETADKSLSTAEKNGLAFDVLTDLQNKISRQYGVVFKLEKEVAKAYQKGFDLHAYNGDDSDELPLAATYIIGTDGIVKYAFLDADYRNRAEPNTIVKELKKLK